MLTPQIELPGLVDQFDNSLQTLASTLQSIEKHISEQHVQLEKEKSSLAERRDVLEQEERITGEEEKSFRKERRAFETLVKEAANLTMPNDDILELNVGGEEMTTCKSTLCSVPGSMLDAMFSGRHTLKMTKGRYFLDRDPTTFKYVPNSAFFLMAVPGMF